jgi:hypothetical protein
MVTSSSFYEKVVRVTYAYLGPAADRFVTRQIRNHLDKKPEQLTQEDLPELIDWMRLAMGFLTQDKQMIEDYVDRLHKLQTLQKKLQKSTKPTSRIGAHAHKAR